MNEGKPTKAKWWSRPRPHGAGPDTTPDHLTEPGPSGATVAPGTAEVEFPGAVGAADARPPARTPGAATDARTQPGTTDATASREEAREGDNGGDYELDRPGRSAATAGAAADGDGDFELERPVPRARGGELGGGPSDAVRPRAVAVSATGAGSDAAPVGLAPGAGAGGSGAVSADRHPQPLHDPDPYGTPPYGQPGPWAPAPPVQHPAATPAHGTHVPAGAAAPGTSFDAAAQATPFDAASQATPFDATAQAAAGAPAPVPHDPAGAPAPGAPRAPYVDTAQATPAQSSHPAQSSPPPAPWQNYDPWAAPGPLQQNGAAVASVRQRRKRAKKVLVLGAVVLALVSGGVGGAVGAYLERNGGMGDVELPQARKEAPGRAPDSVAGIAAHALPSVVTLHVRGSEEEGTGTGFVLDSQGHILTNNHVIEPAGRSGEISVTFSGGETAKAEVVGHDSGYDLAVVKVSGVSGLDPMPLGNSDNVQVGDPVVAIGAPFDLANTVTSGIISAKERPITAGGEKGGSDLSYVDALQTDAPINPGNSGGPLLDSKARVIGINSAIRSADNSSDLEGGQAGSIGLGFAIPINQGKRVAEELINTGKATHPVIGVTLDMDYTGDGARVGTRGNGGGPPVTAGGPGAEAGIKAGDIVTEVDGRRVHSGEELIVKTRAHRPGDRLRLTLRRGGREKQVTLVLGSADGD